MEWELSAPQRFIPLGCRQDSRISAPTKTLLILVGDAGLHLGSARNIQQQNYRKATSQHTTSSFQMGRKLGEEKALANVLFVL